MSGTIAKLTLGVLLILTLSASGRPDHASNSALTVVYVGAEDCAPCRVWRRDYLPAFSLTAEFSRITFHEIVAPKLFDLLDDAYWPLDMRRYRDRLSRGSGVPYWFVVADGKVIRSAQGLHEWSDAIVPAIKSRVR